MTNIHKQQVVNAIEAAILNYGAAARVASKCGINEAYISLMRNGHWDNKMLKDEHWHKVALALDILFDGWQNVETFNFRVVWQTLDTAKRQSMFLAVSNSAGSGKTATAREYHAATSDNGTFFFQVPHTEMSKSEFLDRLCQCLGMEAKKGKQTSAQKSDAILRFFAERFGECPLLIIDEADKLSDGGMRFLISLYNYAEGRIGCVIMGTEHLKQRFNTGVKHARLGWDELASRFGRRFISLRGFTKQEVYEIAKANGLDDKTLAASIFEACEPTSTVVENQSMKIVRDARSIRRAIERELLKRKPNLRPAITERPADYAEKPLALPELKPSERPPLRVLQAPERAARPGT